MRWLMLLCLLCTPWPYTTGLRAAEAAGPWEVRHERAFWRGQPGVLSINGEGIEFTRTGKKGAEAGPRVLRWEDIQQLTLAERRIEIVTYHDVTWQLGRDRMIRFRLEGTGSSFSAAEPGLRTSLGQRLINTLREGPGRLEQPGAKWKIPAKRTGLIQGVEGRLVFTGEHLRFETPRAGESRIWPVTAISNIAQTGPLSLTVTVPERALSDEGGYRSFLFQLKQPLEAARYRELWRAIERAHGTRLRFGGIQ